MKLAPAHAALLAVLALLGAACGESGGGESPEAGQVRDTIGQLEEALGDGDLERVCDEIFTPEARRRAGGEECARRLERTTARLEDPSIEVVEVVAGPRDATARVRAGSEDGRPALDVIRLLRIEDRYRVESLSGG